MRKGFTLLELLIVVIVIGILATIAIPQFLSSIEKARVAKAKNALGLLSHAMKMYRAEHDTYALNATAGDMYANLERYIDLEQVEEDNDWDYAESGTNATHFTLTANRTRGGWNGSTITILQNGTCGGDHDLRGPDCGGS